MPGQPATLSPQPSAVDVFGAACALAFGGLTSGGYPETHPLDNPHETGAVAQPCVETGNDRAGDPRPTVFSCPSGGGAHPLDIDTIVKEAVASVCAATAAQLTAETDLAADLGLDSIDLVEAASAIEHRIDAILPDAKLVACGTVGDLIGLTRRVYERHDSPEKHSENIHDTNVS